MPKSPPSGNSHASLQVPHHHSSSILQDGAPWKPALHRLQRPSLHTIAASLRLCAKAKALSDGKLLHCLLIKRGLEQNSVLGSLVLQMYDKCGAHEDALVLFAHLRERHVFSWNALIRTYAQQGKNQEALNHFVQMQLEAVIPNKVTFICLLSACANQAAFREGCYTHARTTGSRFELDIVGGSALVNMYGKCGRLQDAKKVFDEMPERDVVLWNSIISAYAEHEHGREAVQLFDHMQGEGVMPDKVTFVALLAACASQGALIEGKWTHARLVDCRQEAQTEADIIVETALVNMYGKCGKLDDAWTVFYKMSKRNVVSWTAMIAVSAQQRDNVRAFKLFDQMQWEGVMPNKVTYVSILLACATKGALPEGKQLHMRILETGLASDVVVGNAILNMYGKCDSLEDAQRVFERLLLRDVVTWNAIIAVYADKGRGKETLQYLKKMQREGVTPDKVTFISILAGCASQAALAEGEQIHAHILNRGWESDVLIGNSLINMYGKCGRLETAQRIFDKMTERNVISWTALIATYAQEGRGKDALRLFGQMRKEGVLPNQVTFLSMLAACSHAGLVDEGRHFFTSMVRDHGISPSVDHCACMVDLLGRAGRLDEAECFINSMRVQPNAAVFMALLGACRYQDDLQRGERAAQRVYELDPGDSAPYLMLSKMYVSAGRADAAAKVLGRTWSKGLKELPPRSSLKRDLCKGWYAFP